VVATGAAPRLNIIKALFEHAKVRYLVLEKVLFQNSSDYKEAARVIELAETKVWVNCPRRMFTAYSDLKLMLNREAPVTMKVSGGEWGLACNAIHFIDILAFLTESTVSKINSSDLESKVYTSRRDGYIELYGTIAVEFSNGHRLILECTHDNSPITIQLNDANSQFLIDEMKGDIHINGELSKLKMIVRYQSELSQFIATQALSFAHAEITSFDESCELHVPFIESILEFYNRTLGLDSKILPIT
jgi:hypothetical protein